jgi:hypothetical protein
MVDTASGMLKKGSETEMQRPNSADPERKEVEK